MDDNEMIQKFLLHNITEENINIEYEQLLTIYKNINKLSEDEKCQSTI